ncbi:MAG TPA: hypothetical protein VFH95_09310 [Candidatus Kapabacteria bacterium]|nr:hypothetical protein [Candidatus Kapabacteria bacterium]
MARVYLEIGYKNMQTYRAEATVNDEGKVILSLPFPHGQKVEIIARPSTSLVEDDEAWERMAFEDFFNGYAEEDAMYDHYFEWKKNIDSGKQ